MIVPKYIKQKMHKIAELNQTANALMNDVEEWLKKQNIDTEAFRSGDGHSLEELEYGNDVTDVLCYRIENNLLGQDYYDNTEEKEVLLNGNY